jgi:hypothetical protein
MDIILQLQYPWIELRAAVGWSRTWGVGFAAGVGVRGMVGLTTGCAVIAPNEWISRTTVRQSTPIQRICPWH